MGRRMQVLHRLRMARAAGVRSFYLLRWFFARILGLTHSVAPSFSDHKLSIPAPLRSIPWRTRAAAAGQSLPVVPRIASPGKLNRCGGFWAAFAGTRRTANRCEKSRSGRRQQGRGRGVKGFSQIEQTLQSGRCISTLKPGNLFLRCSRENCQVCLRKLEVAPCPPAISSNHGTQFALRHGSSL